MFSQSQTVARLCLGTLQLCKTLPTLGPVVRFFAATRLDILSNPPLLHQANWLLRTASHRCLLTYPVFRSQKSSKLSFNWNNSELLHPARRRLPIHLVESIRNISGGSKGNITKIDSKIAMLTSKKKGQAKKKRTLADSEDREVIAYATADEYDLEGMNKGFKELGLYVRSPHHVPGMAHTSAHPDSGADLEGFDPSIDGGKGVKGYSHSSSQANEMQDVIPDISEVLHVLGLYKINPEERQIYFFRDGAVVFWNVSELERINVLTYISRYALGATVSKETVEEQSESFPYMYSEGKTRLANDSILLSDSGPTHLERYTFSNALALSVKLGVWESELDYYIDSIEKVTEEMKSGRVILKNKEVLAHLGQLYSLRHSLKMSSGLLDTPDYYWERKNLEQIYERTTTNLSINRRMQVMSDKLNNCLEMMSVLKDYHAVVHGHRLEVIIIVLIVVEVIFEAAHFLSKEDNEDRRSVTDTKTAASITQNEVSTSH